MSDLTYWAGDVNAVAHAEASQVPSSTPPTPWLHCDQQHISCHIDCGTTQQYLGFIHLLDPNQKPKVNSSYLAVSM